MAHVIISVLLRYMVMQAFAVIRPLCRSNALLTSTMMYPNTGAPVENPF